MKPVNKQLRGRDFEAPPMSSRRYPHLLSPSRIGGMEIRNRIVVSAMGVSLSETDGACGERLVAYHEAQAKGGAGLIIAGVAAVAWPVGAVLPNQTAISQDRYIPRLEVLTRRVHAHGAKIAVQLHHGGLAAAYSASAHQVPLWAPSLPRPAKGDFLDFFLPEELKGLSAGAGAPTIKVLEQADIDLVVSQFAAAALRAKTAGFDAIELHSAHGYLLSSFLSPKSNNRTDGYGGQTANRARILLEVIAAVRQAVGHAFPVWCKLDAHEIGREGGITIDHAIEAARLVEAAGVQAIAASSYHDASRGKLHSASNVPHEPEANIPAATQIRQAVSIPVIASGRVEPDAAERHIAEGRYEFLGMGRKLLADPELPSKLIEGRQHDVRPCIYCYTCVSTAYAREPVRCAVRAETGFESEAPAVSVRRSKIAVVGGGPGGMEAAWRLREAGHEVTLFEKALRLGGTLRFASLAYPANETLLDWLVRRVEASGARLRLGVEANLALIQEMAPEAIVVATGARRDLPPIPGGDLPHVYSGEDLRALMMGETSSKGGLATRLASGIGAATGLTADLDFVRKATRAWMPLGKSVVVIGGELVGVELSEFLHERGREVTILEPASHLGRGLLLVRRMRILSELREHGVAMHAGVTGISISRNAVSFTSAAGEVSAAPADNVIVAMGAARDLTLADQLKAAGFRVETAGDCNGVGYIEGAIRGGYRAARALSA
jgi:2,4-dienoyl-CoA reductase-like NADH-dependent reductase (Old Yellow Enzyme family)/NADPH-dependent 2,4-dienoyl-CoA reductase/sulfur reductase-like enzyme